MTPIITKKASLLKALRKRYPSNKFSIKSSKYKLYINDKLCSTIGDNLAGFVHKNYKWYDSSLDSTVLPHIIVI